MWHSKKRQCYVMTMNTWNGNSFPCILMNNWCITRWSFHLFCMSGVYHVKTSALSSHPLSRSSLIFLQNQFHTKTMYRCKILLFVNAFKWWQSVICTRTGVPYAWNARYSPNNNENVFGMHSNKPRVTESNIWDIFSLTRESKESEWNKTSKRFTESHLDTMSNDDNFVSIQIIFKESFIAHIIFRMACHKQRVDIGQHLSFDEIRIAFITLVLVRSMHFVVVIIGIVKRHTKETGHTCRVLIRFCTDNKMQMSNENIWRIFLCSKTWKVSFVFILHH